MSFFIEAQGLSGFSVVYVFLMFEGDRHLHGAGEQLFHTFFAQSFAKSSQLCGVTRPLVFKILIAVKVLPSRCLTSALNHLIALVERMLWVRQCHHQTGGQTRTHGIGDVASGNGRDRAK